MKNFSKKIALMASVAVMSLSPVLGQGYTFTQGGKGSLKTHIPSTVTLMAADNPNEYYTVEIDGVGINYKVRSWKVRHVDMNYKELRGVKIPDVKGCYVKQVIRDGQRLHLIIDASEKKRLALRHVAVDLDQFSISADSMLLDIEIGKKTDYYHWMHHNEASGCLAIVHALVDNKTEQAEAHAMLFDSGMQRLWAHPIETGSISQIIATEDTTIVTAGIQAGEKGSVGTVVEFSEIDRETTRQGFFRTEASLDDLVLIGFRGGNVLATALETSSGIGWAGNMRAGSVITTGTTYTGCAAFCFSLNERKLLNSSSYQFTKEDASMFYGASLVADITSPSINFLHVKKVASNGQGGAVLYQRSWKEKITRTGPGTAPMSEETVYLKGMLLVHVDAMGNILWTRRIPHDNIGYGAPIPHQETDLVVQDGVYHVFTNESVHEGEEYKPDGRANKALLQALGALSVYTFRPDGSAGKKMLADKGITTIMTPLQHSSSGRYLLLSGSVKPCISEITIR